MLLKDVARFWFALIVGATGVLLVCTPAFADCAANLQSARNTATENAYSDLVFDRECAHIYFANPERGQVDVYRVASGALARVIPLPGRPESIDLSPSGDRLYAVLSGRLDVAVIDTGFGPPLVSIAMPEQPVSVAVAANGAVLISTETGLYKGSSDGAVKITGFTAGGVVRANADRSAIAASSVAQGALRGFARYRSSDDRTDFIRMETHNAFRLAAFASGGAQAFVISRNYANESEFFTMDSAFQFSAPHRAGYAEEIAISPDGNSGFIARQDNVIRVVNLSAPATPQFIPIGDEITGARRKISLSPDGALIAVLTRTGFAVIPVTTRAAENVSFVMQSSVFPGPMSLLRLFNGGNVGADGRAYVTLADAATGAVLTEWTSPPIAIFTAPQFSIAQIESEGGRAFDKPQLYNVTIRTDFPGLASHVVWRPGQAITNVTTCADPSSLPLINDRRLDIVTNVHSSLIGDDYQSFIEVVNTSSDPSTTSLAVAHAGSARGLGRYQLQVPAGTGRRISMREVERSLNIDPAAHAPFLNHYIVTADRPLVGYLRHLVVNANGGVTADMTPACALNWYAP